MVTGKFAKEEKLTSAKRPPSKVPAPAKTLSTKKRKGDAASSAKVAPALHKKVPTDVSKVGSWYLVLPHLFLVSLILLLCINSQKQPKQKVPFHQPPAAADAKVPFQSVLGFPLISSLMLQFLEFWIHSLWFRLGRDEFRSQLDLATKRSNMNPSFLQFMDVYFLDLDEKICNIFGGKEKDDFAKATTTELITPIVTHLESLLECLTGDSSFCFDSKCKGGLQQVVEGKDLDLKKFLLGHLQEHHSCSPSYTSRFGFAPQLGFDYFALDSDNLEGFGEDTASMIFYWPLVEHQFTHVWNFWNDYFKDCGLDVFLDNVKRKAWWRKKHATTVLEGIDAELAFVIEAPALDKFFDNFKSKYSGVIDVDAMYSDGQQASIDASPVAKGVSTRARKANEASQGPEQIQHWTRWSTKDPNRPATKNKLVKGRGKG